VSKRDLRQHGGVLVRLRILLLTAVAFVAGLPQLRRRPVVRFDTLEGWRYPTYLLTAFAGVGAVCVDPVDVRRARRILGWRRFLARVRVDTPFVPAAQLDLCLREPTSPSADETRRIQVVRRYYCDAAPHELHAPYFAHPDFYLSGRYLRCRDDRSTSRWMRVFFAGTSESSSYTEQFAFDLLSRPEILRDVREHFDVSQLHVAHLTDPQAPEGIVVSITDRPGQDIAKHALAPADYLRAVGSADFFLCLPGFRIPHSHNLVEAMSVGTIPILNYARYVHPPLSPGDNCLVFDTLDELREVLQRALTMSPDEVARMRANVIAYYDRELDPAAFAQRLLAADPSIDTLLVNDESGT
jgi:glycosyltransferase involved in cell wall biosynthesis